MYLLNIFFEYNIHRVYFTEILIEILRCDSLQHSYLFCYVSVVLTWRCLVRVSSKDIFSPQLFLFLGLLISGGLFFGRLTDVEVWVPTTGQHCTLPSLPAGRDFHSQDGPTVCGGGYWGSVTRTSCLTLTGEGTWEGQTNLLMER